MSTNGNRVATEAETIAALRRFNWLRDDGDGERLHEHRQPDAKDDTERCDGFYKSVCRYKKGHTGPHQVKP